MSRLHYGRKEGQNLRELYPKEFNSFSAAKQRVNGQNPRGARWYQGVEFRFNCFYDFLEEIGPKPTPKHSLDRIDTAGHYEPGNVRWATVEEQNNNRKNSRLITWEGETHSIRKWERIKGWRQNFLRKRLNSGWPVEKAMIH